MCEVCDSQKIKALQEGRESDREKEILLCSPDIHQWPTREPTPQETDSKHTLG